MLFKNLLSKRLVTLSTQGRYSKPLWRYTMMRYAGSDPSTSPGSSVSEAKPGWHMEDFTCIVDPKYVHSPVNIITSHTVQREYPPISIPSYDEPGIKMILANNGHVVTITFPDSQLDVVDGGMKQMYRAHHLHFHWGSNSKTGSEHLIDNQHFPMEMHIVNYNIKSQNIEKACNEKSGLSILAFLFEISTNDNPALNPIISTLPSVKQPYTSVPLVLPSLRSILPDSLSQLYQYTDASILGHPYITWTVFIDTVKISEKQIEQFRSLDSGHINPETNKPHRLGDNNRDPEKIPKLYIFRNFSIQPEAENKKPKAFTEVVSKMALSITKRLRKK